MGRGHRHTQEHMQEPPDHPPATSVLHVGGELCPPHLGEFLHLPGMLLPPLPKNSPAASFLTLGLPVKPRASQVPYLSRYAGFGSLPNVCTTEPLCLSDADTCFAMSLMKFGGVISLTPFSYKPQLLLHDFCIAE